MARNGQRDIFLVLDNDPTHNLTPRGKGRLSENRHRIDLHRLPPYSPMFNPMESVCKMTKRMATHNSFHKTARARDSAWRAAHATHPLLDWARGLVAGVAWVAAMELDELLRQIRAFRVCEGVLPLGPRPVLRASATARVLVVGQAPGTRVHATGIPWNDPSGDRLRSWLGMERHQFYDESRIAIVPMGLCYPGRGKGGDLPPRPECAKLWFGKLLPLMPEIRLTLLVGAYAQAYYLGQRCKATLAETVQAHEEYAPLFFPLPHPSPRNTLWLRNRPWFEAECVPLLRSRVALALDGSATS